MKYNNTEKEIELKEKNNRIIIIAIIAILVISALSLFIYTQIKTDNINTSEIKKEDKLKIFFNEFYLKNPRCIKYGNDAHECVGLFRKEFYKEFSGKNINSFINLPLTFSFSKKIDINSVIIESERTPNTKEYSLNDYNFGDNSMYVVEFSAMPNYSKDYKTNIKVYSKVSSDIFSQLKTGKQYKVSGIFNGYYIDRDRKNRRKTEFGYPPIVKNLYGEVWFSTGNIMIDHLVFEEIS